MTSAQFGTCSFCSLLISSTHDTLVNALALSLCPKIMACMNALLSIVELTDYNMKACNMRLSFAVKLDQGEKLS